MFCVRAAAGKSTLQHAATRCNTLQHAATRCNTTTHYHIVLLRCAAATLLQHCCNTDGITCSLLQCNFRFVLAKKRVFVATAARVIRLNYRVHRFRRRERWVGRERENEHARAHAQERESERKRERARESETAREIDRAGVYCGFVATAERAILNYHSTITCSGKERERGRGKEREMERGKIH